MKQLKISQQIMDRRPRSLDKYMYEISKHRPLKHEEEAALAKKIRAGDSKAHEILVKANLRFVVSVAKQYQHTGMPLEDLISEGNIGLMKAAWLFDETKGFKFISHAVWWIRQTIHVSISEHARTIRLPQNRINDIKKLADSHRHLEQRHHRTPTEEEMAEHSGIPLWKVKEHLQEEPHPTSLDAPLSTHGDGRSLHDTYPAESTHDTRMHQHSIRTEINHTLSFLNKKERAIIQKFFGLNGHREMSLDEIASELGISGERVRQLKQRALKELVGKRGIHWLKEYL